MAKRNLNVDWKQYYKDHLVTMQEAVDAIEDGDVIWAAQASANPAEFFELLYKKKDQFNNVTVWSNVYNYPGDMLFDGSIKGHLNLKSIYQLPMERIGIDMGTIMPLAAGYDQYYSCLWENGVNTYALRFCPPDEDGWCNVSHYTLSNHAGASTAPQITKKIAIIDRTGIYPSPGSREETCVHVTDFDYIVECDSEMIAIPSPAPTEFDRTIASYIIPYLREGDKVQIGYGGLGEIIMEEMNKFDGTFEIYTEVFCDSMVPLVQSGKITKLRASSPSGCVEESFKWLATTDKDVKLLPNYDCIEPLGIMEQENIVAINSTFMIDLLGQCCSEAQGLKPYTGMGGSLAYIYGAQRCVGGRSFICLRSTYKDKQGERQTNVVPWLPEGVIVSMLKNYVMFLVTEYGVADVYLKTYVDRIKAIIKIAHPDYRAWLKEKILTTPLIKEGDFEGYDYNDGVYPEPRQPFTCVPFRKYNLPVDNKILGK